MTDQNQDQSALWSDRTLWQRIGVVAVALWLVVIVIASFTTSHFVWWENYGRGPGHAAVYAFWGTVAITVLCAGIPWIADVVLKRPPTS